MQSTKVANFSQGIYIIDKKCNWLSLFLSSLKKLLFFFMKSDSNLSLTVSYYFCSASDSLKDSRISSASSPIAYKREETYLSSSSKSRFEAILYRCITEKDTLVYCHLSNYVAPPLSCSVCCCSIIPTSLPPCGIHWVLMFTEGGREGVLSSIDPHMGLYGDPYVRTFTGCLQPNNVGLYTQYTSHKCT